jgi:transitional endoplasmic reticulum ATPase
MPLAEDVDLNVIAAATHDFTGAELSRLCQEAGLMALRQDVGTHCICFSHFEAALKNLASNRLSVVS